MKRFLALTFGVLIVGAGIFFVLGVPVQSVPMFRTEKEAIEEKVPVALVFVGDMMFDRGVKRSVTNNFDGDYAALFANTPYLQDADIAFANLEGPVATGGHNVGSKFSFRMDPSMLSAVKNAGIDIVSFANNHVGDYTHDAFDETLFHLNENGIMYAGAGSSHADVISPRVITVRGTRIGYLGMTDVGPAWLRATDTDSGILLASDPDLANIIANAKASVDVLVVSVHWGTEYSPATAHQEILAHRMIDSGADIVVGHHPHVMERMETYNGKLIFYSLGNFIFDQYFSVHTLRGMVATVTVDPKTKGLTASLAVSPMTRTFVPQPLVPFTESLLLTEAFTL